MVDKYVCHAATAVTATAITTTNMVVVVIVNRLDSILLLKTNSPSTHTLENHLSRLHCCVTDLKTTMRLHNATRQTTKFEFECVFYRVKSVSYANERFNH